MRKRWIEITRYPPVDHNGYIVWFRVLEGTERSYDEVDEQLFGSKRDAYTWAKQHYPGVKVVYTTYITRKGITEGY